MVAITALTLNTATAIPDQTYKVADPAIVLAVPTYSWTNSLGQTKFTYTLISPTPSLVTLLGAGNQTSQIQIVTTDYAKTG
jgi:hypothetical protein